MSASATWDGADTIVGAALDAFGRVDVLVNNATAGPMKTCGVSKPEWDLTMDVNLKGYYAVMRAAIPHMAHQGGGAIVNTSSASGLGHPSHAAYGRRRKGSSA